MKNVVCDTNIWYDLNSDEFSSFSDSTNLIATMLSAFELLTSEKLFFNFNEVKKACSAIIHLSTDFISETPMTHLGKFQTANNAQILNSNIFNELQALCELDAQEIFSSEEIQELCIKKRKDLKKYFVDPFSEFYVEPKKVISVNKKESKSIIKTKSFKTNGIKEIKQKILNEYNQYFPNNVVENVDNFCWDDIELYVHTRYCWSNKLKFEETMKISSNDLIDLLNLIYVKKDWLYWTKEAKWINIIKEAGMEKYLFKI